MSIQTDANTVLRKLVYSPTQNPKNLYYSRDLEYDSVFRNYNYCVSVFQFANQGFPEFITFLNGTKPAAHIHMKPGQEEEIKQFLDEGGCEAFKDYAAYGKFIKESKSKAPIPTIDNSQHFHAPVTNSIVSQTQSLRDKASISESIHLTNMEPTATPKKKYPEFIKWVITFIVSLAACILAYYRFLTKT